jgi:SAM-dependent methyltransferase
VSFDVPAESYDRFMGEWSRPLAPQLADFAGVRGGQPASHAIDVGCGPGSLTEELVGRLGASAVAAVDPSASFVAAARARHPGVDVRQAKAEALPFPDGAFDAALAQLVVHFMADPVAGLREMARVTRGGGTVAVSVWDYAGGRDPLGPFWKVARALHPDVRGEAAFAGAREGHLAELLAAAGLKDVSSTELSVSRSFGGFDAWWQLFTLRVGPAGALVAGLPQEERDALRDACRSKLPDGEFTLTAAAWAARGIV